MKKLLLWVVLAAATFAPVLAQTEEICSGSLPSRLAKGEQALVVSSSPLTIRQEPDSADTLGEVAPGGKISVMDGPVCGSARQFTWWDVYVYDQALSGWVAEANATDYWLEPFVPTPVPTLPTQVIEHGVLSFDESQTLSQPADAQPVDQWTFTAEQGDLFVFTLDSGLPGLRITGAHDLEVTPGNMLNLSVYDANQFLLVAPKAGEYRLSISTFNSGEANPNGYHLLAKQLVLAKDHILKFGSSVRGDFNAADTLQNYELWAFDGIKDAVAVFSALAPGNDTSPNLLLLDSQGQPLTYGVHTAEATPRTQLGFVMDKTRYYLLVRSIYTGSYTLDFRRGTTNDLSGTAVTNFNLGMACPYVYTRQREGEPWAYDTTILYRLVGPAARTVQIRPLAQFDGHLLIREVEPETSHIDSLYVLVTDAEGQVHRLDAANALLAANDDRELVLHQGDEIALSFAGFAGIADPQSAAVAAEGYYVPQ